jgi:hypothetical protein
MLKRMFTNLPMAFLLSCSAVFLGLASPGMAAAVEPVPEADQGRLASSLIDAFHAPRPATPPRKLHVVYFTPSDREPAPRCEERLEGILEDIRAFYRTGMERAGLGPKTFALDRDAQGRLKFHWVKGRHPSNRYSKADGFVVTGECRPVLEAAGINLDQETVMVFCNLVDWDETRRTFRHHSPYAGSWGQFNGICWASDCVIEDVRTLKETVLRVDDGEYGDLTLGKHNTIFIGGVAHELGHAFGLPHGGERWDQKSLGTSLLGGGNHTYREELRGEGPGSFLSLSSALKLAARPLFNGSDKQMTARASLELRSLDLTTAVHRPDLAGRRGTLRLTGTVSGSPVIYGVIAYFDTFRDGGYRAPTATTVPDAAGQFAIEISDLAPCANGEIHLEFCHVNGAYSQQRLPLAVAADGTVNLAGWKLRKALEPVANAVVAADADGAQKALAQLEQTAPSSDALAIARALAGTVAKTPKLIPAEVPATIRTVPVGNLAAKSAVAGWLVPAQNRIPPNAEIPAPFLDANRLYATGLFAHADSRYVFDLGGKWNRLKGEGGLHTAQQPFGSVLFIVKADGKELFRSPLIKGSAHANYDVDLTGAKTLELLVEGGPDGKSNDWGLWLEPTLQR